MRKPKRKPKRVQLPPDTKLVEVIEVESSEPIIVITNYTVEGGKAWYTITYNGDSGTFDGQEFAAFTAARPDVPVFHERYMQYD